MSTYKVGRKFEKLIKERIEVGDFDGHPYRCELIPQSRFSKRDLFGADILCVNRNNWALFQVKYRSDRLPPREEKTIQTMNEAAMPETTKRVLVRIDGRTNKILWEEVGSRGWPQDTS